MPKRQFHIGDTVRFRFGTRTIQGVVKEDRGPIGVKGRRLYRIEFHLGPQDEYLNHVELPAESLQLASDTVSKS